MIKDALLKDLANANLKRYSINTFKKYGIKETDKRWKRPKNDTVVYDYVVSFFGLYKKRLILRKFYCCQRWKDKQKVFEVLEYQRYIAGSNKKIKRYMYYVMSHGLYIKKGDDKYRPELNEWKECKLNSNELYKKDNYNNRGCNFLKRSMHKYSGYEFQNTLGLFEYLAVYEKKPQLEIISKCGLGYLLNDLRQFKWKYKDIRCIGVDKADIKLMKQLYITPSIFKEYEQKIKRYKLNERYQLNRLMNMENLISDLNLDIKMSNKFVDYFTKNDGHQYYIDYLRMVHQLGLHLTTNVKYPGNIKKAHDELIKKLDDIKNAEIDKKIQKRVNKNLKKYRFHFGNYIITPANSVHDLNVESRELNHCVKSYYQDYADSKTNIFLIRNVNDVYTPFVTLEMKGNTIKQCRTKNNADVSSDVVCFAKEWAKNNKIDLGILEKR